MLSTDVASDVLVARPARWQFGKLGHGSKPGNPSGEGQCCSTRCPVATHGSVAGGCERVAQKLAQKLSPPPQQQTPTKGYPIGPPLEPCPSTPLRHSLGHPQLSTTGNSPGDSPGKAVDVKRLVAGPAACPSAPRPGRSPAVSPAAPRSRTTGPPAAPAAGGAGRRGTPPERQSHLRSRKGLLSWQQITASRFYSSGCAIHSGVSTSGSRDPRSRASTSAWSASSTATPTSTASPAPSR